MNTQTPLRELMTTDLTVIKLDTSFKKIKSIFDANSFHHLPVVDNMAMVKGVVSKHDFTNLAYRLSNNTGGKVYSEKTYNNIFAKDMSTNQIQQLKRSNSDVRNLQFLTDGRLSYLSGYSFYAVDVQTGMTEEIASWAFSERPEALKKPKDYIAKEQLKLISVLSERRNERQKQFDHKLHVAKNNSTVAAQLFHFPQITA